MSHYEGYIFGNLFPILKYNTLIDSCIDSPQICIKVWIQNIF